jgi:hypothetical protein
MLFSVNVDMNLFHCKTSISNMNVSELVDKMLKNDMIPGNQQQQRKMPY